GGGGADPPVLGVVPEALPAGGVEVERWVPRGTGHKEDGQPGEHAGGTDSGSGPPLVTDRDHRDSPGPAPARNGGGGTGRGGDLLGESVPADRPRPRGIPGRKGGVKSRSGKGLWAAGGETGLEADKVVDRQRRCGVGTVAVG